jgi:hypothetical protein
LEIARLLKLIIVCIVPTDVLVWMLNVVRAFVI